MGMIAYYHVGPSSNRLDLAHTVRIGEPWTAGSVLDHLLVFLPYAYGPHLEHLEWQTGPARLLSVMPVPRRSATSKPEKAPTHSSNYLRMVKQPSPTHCDPQLLEQRDAQPLGAMSDAGAQPSARLAADPCARPFQTVDAATLLFAVGRAGLIRGRALGLVALGELLQVQQLPSSHHQVSDGQPEGEQAGGPHDDLEQQPRRGMVLGYEDV